MNSKYCLEGSRHNGEGRQTSIFLVKEPLQKAFCCIAQPHGEKRAPQPSQPAAETEADQLSS